MMFILYAETEIKEVTHYVFLVRLLHELIDKKNTEVFTRDRFWQEELMLTVPVYRVITETPKS